MDESEAWAFDLERVSRIEADPADDLSEVIYSVVFNVDGPDANAEIEVFVSDVPDPAQLIIMAMSRLHLALAAWARITLGRRIANDEG